MQNIQTANGVNMATNLITIKNCRIETTKETVVPEFNWSYKKGEAWLIIGPNGGGKADLFNALAGTLKITPNNQDGALYSNIFHNSTEIVSLERAARIIEEERENDESEYVEGGVDIGRTGRVFITEGLVGHIKKNAPLPPEAQSIQNHPAVKLCGIEKILDRGLKYMSTGEIRRTLLARALISEKKLLLLSDPFAGLDVQSRGILLNFFDEIVKKQLTGESETSTNIILTMERWHEIPDSITNVLEISNKKITFCGLRKDYEEVILKRNSEKQISLEKSRQNFEGQLEQTLQETAGKIATGNNLLAPGVQKNNTTSNSLETIPVEKTLIQMKNVNVGWGDNQVLKNINWTLQPGEHWLIQGPNGSGKTTFLELITGDNKQVFCNEVYMFGKKRGTGETIWDIKQHLGIVSYRLHVEYRMVGGTSLQNVIISGFKDSIGLYETPTDIEISAAKKWLALGGFQGREHENFGNLSYGEQRAVLILRSAVKSPKILILDEPCHGLDENYREKILHLMELIGNGNSTTMLHVTHDPSEVLSCEHHILQLLPGQDPMYKIITK